jgi:hypothetical protein
MRVLQPSAWTSYPDEIKFHSIDIKWKKEATVLVRNTYTVLDLVKDIGGLGAFLYNSLYVIIPIFGSIKLTALIASHGYYDEFLPKANPLDQDNKKNLKEYGDRGWMFKYFSLCFVCSSNWRKTR